jgi:lipoprotein-anchoring transpeptidase ErfK/SrfK
MRRIARIAEWPEWRPSADLLKRKDYKPLPGGPGNPLGARAIYFETGELGIHGTNAPKTIGQAVTLGCFRMVNDDVVDFAKRTKSGAGVVIQ